MRIAARCCAVACQGLHHVAAWHGAARQAGRLRCRCSTGWLCLRPWTKEEAWLWRERVVHAGNACGGSTFHDVAQCMIAWTVVCVRVTCGAAPCAARFRMDGTSCCHLIIIIIASAPVRMGWDGTE